MKIQITNSSCCAVSITEKVKTLNDACNQLGIIGDTYVELSDNISKLFPFVADVTKAAIITEALNEGWKPNWDNSSEKKWYPYFDMRSSSFSLDSVSGYCGRSVVPSRLCFKSRELAQYAVTQFPEVYKSLFLNY